MKILKSDLFKYFLFTLFLGFIMSKINNYEDAKFVCDNYPNVIGFAFCLPSFIISLSCFTFELFFTFKSKIKSSDKKVN